MKGIKGKSLIRLTLVRMVLLTLALGSSTPSWAERLYDFEFKQMDIRKIITSLAQLEGKSVQFTQAVASKPIDVSLKRVTPSFAISVVLESYGYVAINKGAIYHVMSSGERKPGAKPTVVIPLRHVMADEIENNVRTFLADIGSVSLNKTRNALVVSAPDEMMAKVRDVIQTLDQEISQVHIEAKIIETTVTFSRSLGLEWGTDLSDRFNGVSFSMPAGEKTMTAGFRTSVTDSINLQTKLMTGERNGEVKVISQPRITTLNGIPAAIDNNITFNIRTLASTGTATPTNAATPGQVTGQTPGVAAAGGLQTVTAGLSLVVTPFIVSDEKVRLTIKVSKSDPDFSNRIDGIPGITDNTASTSLIVNNGQMASIGGLITQTRSDSSSGVPILSAIPIIGMLFGNIEKEKKEMELLIFLTPKVFKASTADVWPSSGGGTKSTAPQPESAKPVSVPLIREGSMGGSSIGADSPKPDEAASNPSEESIKDEEAPREPNSAAPAQKGGDTTSSPPTMELQPDGKVKKPTSYLYEPDGSLVDDFFDVEDYSNVEPAPGVSEGLYVARYSKKPEPKKSSE